MTTQAAVKTAEAKPVALAAPAAAQQVAIFQKPRLPWSDHIERAYGEMGVTKASWRALIDAVYPAAKSVDSVILALSYCKARKLDPFKRPVHIVPVWDKDKRGYVDTVWPGISEIRTTAVRTGCFAGCDAAVFGPDKERTFKGSVGRDERAEKREVTLTFPEWAQVTVYRMIDKQRVPIAGPRVYWEETYATIARTELPNEMWQRRKRGQLEKCAEAAALRRAFPEELGNEYTAEEMEGREALTPVAIVQAQPKPAASAAAILDAIVDGNDAPSSETVTDAEVEDHDPETGEILETTDDAAAEAIETKAEDAKPEPSPGWTKALKYFDVMIAEHLSAKGAKEEAEIARTVKETIAAETKRKAITEAEGNELLALWAQRTKRA